MDYSDAFYHVLSRGIERREIFRDEQDQRRFTEPLGKRVCRFKLEVYAFGERFGVTSK
jgi:hypothetical protein